MEFLAIIGICFLVIGVEIITWQVGIATDNDDGAVALIIVNTFTIISLSLVILHLTGNI